MNHAVLCQRLVLASVVLLAGFAVGCDCRQASLNF